VKVSQKSLRLANAHMGKLVELTEDLKVIVLKPLKKN